MRFYVSLFFSFVSFIWYCIIIIIIIIIITHTLIYIIIISYILLCCVFLFSSSFFYLYTIATIIKILLNYIFIYSTKKEKKEINK